MSVHASTLPAKRGRADDPGLNSEGGSAQDSESADSPRMKKIRRDEDGAEVLIRDENFWYDDGTVTLEAGDYQFRVYKGILSNHSPVFEEMFSSQSATSPDGLVVRLDDSPEDLRHLIRAMLPEDK